jgi:hypothetical protein
MAYQRLLVVFATGALLACAAKTPELRVPAETVAPSTAVWREAARELAATISTDIATDTVTRDVAEPVILDPVQGSAPSYFRDFLLAEFVARGLKIAESGESPVHVECRITPIGVLPLTRGVATASAALPGAQVFILCLAARDGAYTASGELWLPVPAYPQVPVGGVVMEVKG